jgi:uncharacterized membrane protein
MGFEPITLEKLASNYQATVNYLKHPFHSKINQKNPTQNPSKNNGSKHLSFPIIFMIPNYEES